MVHRAYYNSIQQSIVQKYLTMIREPDIKHAPIISNLLVKELLRTEIIPLFLMDTYIELNSWGLNE
jgi:hypothetical protein